MKAADEPPYAQLRGEELNEILRPLAPKEPTEALRCLQVIDGFSVEFVAHEPQVLDPVAAAVDENGLMYVAEDADYPYRPEPGVPPLGRIRLLVDKDGDGFYEEGHLFADGLLWPAGIAAWKGGVFVSAPPDIWYLKDTNGDFKADIKEKIYTGFGTDGSQYILNNLQWGSDHKIYASVAGNGGLIRRVDRPDQPPVSVAHKDFGSILSRGISKALVEASSSATPSTIGVTDSFARRTRLFTRSCSQIATCNGIHS